MYSYLSFAIFISLIIVYFGFSMEVETLSLLNLYISTLTLGLALSLASIGFKHWTRDKKKEGLLLDISELEKKLWLIYGAENLADNEIIGSIEESINEGSFLDEVESNVNRKDTDIEKKQELEIDANAIFERFNKKLERSVEATFQYNMAKTACYARLCHEYPKVSNEDFGSLSMSADLHEVRLLVFGKIKITGKSSEDMKEKLKKYEDLWQDGKTELIMNELAILKSWERNLEKN